MLDVTVTNQSASPSRAASRRCLAIVLAAGEGTRMKSARPKVLHEIAGRSMLGHVLAAVTEAGAEDVAVIVGPDRDDVAREAARLAVKAEIFVQTERLGTAHAVLAARAALERGADDVIVAFGDTPLMRPATFQRLRESLAQGAAVAVLGFETREPTGYGRLVIEGGILAAIREEKDASEAERAITLCNAGLMALAGRHALAILDRIGNANAKGEYYLTDSVQVARDLGLSAVALVAEEEEVQGVNDRQQLAGAEAAMQARLRGAAMRNGATLVAPETVFFTHDTRLGRDVVVEPNVVFGPGVVVEDGAVIHSFSYLEGARVGAGALIGPFARLRPGADLAAKVRIGNFVEVKNSTLGVGTKVNHLTYVGDATVGAGTNVGAGTITCNYDGFRKHKTVIGAGAFIGSNSSLVAPVTIGDGAYVGSGTVVTGDVPADALAVARTRQVNKEGWAKAFRDKFAPREKD
ncbi:bifunctional UDP-N-acetylglucosamine diphosphorylase/glucosamine-1-phosphate N-acetyltransferase GlmU [Chelatococcus sp. SYSU_G07232]|uniref:Bifunctional protein GlmU n=1 Tax=Chelatococcus albus TaxID=3047466 RepID=A0ABT7ABZ1_9HYPH|nr:bifunctional UDP-N-acetylglucosamine diphosphorylase/glucosamine-1-phosphate N-acetyltransferase GlmU [Chelatococcus sp. SYSU_G07232]MDJ1156885.1 bifunctional UDP-N-acetylglucosamine diphosphorylase/glucosamine-1-phosphate N-acetyltransferase GlmU [Chelatococcus sp. SYSU_G07232]